MPDERPKPTYLRGRKPVQVKLHDIVHVLSMIHDHGQTKNFIEAAKTSDVAVGVHPKTANFVKDFIASHPTMSAQALAKKVINPEDDCDGKAECQF